MKKIFLDTNILLDVLLDRYPHSEPAQRVWSLAEQKKVVAAISAISIANVFFIVKKLSSSQKAHQAIKTMMEIFKIVEVNAQVLRKALEKQTSDFEDSIQLICAERFRVQAIITRDPTGFPGSKISVIDCPQYLTFMESS